MSRVSLLRRNLRLRGRIFLGSLLYCRLSIRFGLLLGKLYTSINS